MRFHRHSRKRWIKFFLILAVLIAGCLFFVAKKNELKQQSVAFLTNFAGYSSNLNLRVAKVGFQWLSHVKFEGVEVRELGADPSEPPIFSAKEIVIRYRLLDFLAKKPDSKVQLEIKEPRIFWQPHIGIRRPQFPFMDWMRDWALAQRRNLEIHIEGMHFSLGTNSNAEVSGANISFRDSKFKIELPVRHVEVMSADVSSTINIEGEFWLGLYADKDMLKGTIATEGTVVNWQPMAAESHFDFVFSKEGFRLISSDFLGGIHVAGAVDFAHDFDIDFTVQTDNYPLSNLAQFISTAEGVPVPGKVDAEISAEGSPWAPRFEARFRLKDGWIDGNSFKALDIHLDGVYPTLKLTDSRILSKDGSSMRFADKTLEFADLFRDKAFRHLVSEAQQDSVVWGDWAFKRPQRFNDESEFLMQRSFGEHASVFLREFNQPENIEQDEERQMEVGLEYRLRSKDSIKFELREDERFVGVERKLKF